MAETVTMPKLGFDMAEGTLVRWVKVEGDVINKGDVLAEIETDKATVEVESNFSGVVARHLVEQGSILPVGTPIAIIGAPGEMVDPLPAAAAPPAEKAVPDSPVPAPVAVVAPVVEQAAPSDGGRIKASPLAKRMADEKGLNLNLLKGSGPGGRIIRRDVEGAGASGIASTAPMVAQPAVLPLQIPAAPKPVEIPLAGFSAEGIPVDKVIPLDKLRSAIGRRMVESKQQVPHFYVTHEYDVEALLALRKEVNTLLLEDHKLSVNDFIVKAAALTLRQFPNLNAALKGNEVIQYGHINIGVAVALEHGLMTVVTHDADIKPLRIISRELKEMAIRARLGKVRPDDIEGSTFSISNMGMYDVEHFIAIINPPEAGILAVGSARQVPVVVNGEVHPGTRMKVTISVDHRVSDGAEGARFMQVLAEYLEKPLRLLV